MVSFEDLRVRHEILDAVREKGFTAPTPIQEKAIPLIFQGLDLIARAQTGTGKTAAFSIGILQSLDAAAAGVQSLVLVPTRELAVQVAAEFKELGAHLPYRVLAVYGGEDIERQIRALREGVHVVVGTPGRVLDHLERKTLALGGVRIAVLDEADRMLDMGFIDDIDRILKHLPAERQTLLFSATIPHALADLARKYMREPEELAVGEQKTVALVDQYFSSVDPRQKVTAVLQVFEKRDPELAIVFVRTKRGADKLYEMLQRRGKPCLVLHGNLTQAKRDSVMRDFRSKRHAILIATDLAARGLDVEDVELVVNYNLPDDYRTYLHRAGRTGRAGKTGEVLTFTTNVFETRELRKIAQAVGTELKEFPLVLPELPPLGPAPPRSRGGFGGRGGFGSRGGDRGGGHSGFRRGGHGRSLRRGGDRHG